MSQLFFIAKICDGKIDCEDSGDEVCRDGKTHVGTDGSVNYFLCDKSSTRIHNNLVCDGVAQCNDGKDEEDI